MRLKILDKNRMQWIFKENGYKTEVLFSYRIPVAARVIDECGASWYVTKAYYSRTTSKHINSWAPKGFAQKQPQSFFDTLGKGA